MIQNKASDIAAVASDVARLKAAGKSIVLAHGVFDLLHVGHIRHLREAKALGDVLVVTLTEDRFVNKGPHRPAFGDSLRVEVLSALEFVDFVAVSQWPTAVEVIELLKPDVYVKGPDYRQTSSDVTGGISLEEEAVRSVGGRIAYTDDVMFSSSNLLNRFLPSFPPEVRDYLGGIREQFPPAQIRGALDSLATLDVVVIGEAIIDEYVYTSQMGKSAKEPVLAMRFQSRESFAGGALAVANHLANFCKSVTLLTYIGDTDDYDGFIRDHLLPNVKPVFFKKTASPTIVKRRYIEHYSMMKLFEVYEINDELLEADDDATFVGLLEEYVPAADLVLVADFGHGLMTPAAIATVSSKAQFLAVNTQINAANIGFHTISKYPNADYVCIHEGEVRLDARSRRGDLDELAQSLAERLGCPHLLVTRGKGGCTYFDSKRGTYASPALAGSVVDRIGSGDAVLALTAACVARGFEPELIGFIANVVGAQAVQIVGNRSSIERPATIKFIDSLLK